MKFYWSWDGGRGPSEFKKANKAELQLVIDEYCDILGRYQSFNRPLPNNFHLYIKNKINEKPLDVTLTKLSECAFEAAKKYDSNIALTKDVLDILIKKGGTTQ